MNEKEGILKRQGKIAIFIKQKVASSSAFFV
jgi:hypothetical protein